jgi:hypothetical protein
MRTSTDIHLSAILGPWNPRGGASVMQERENRQLKRMSSWPCRHLYARRGRWVFFSQTYLY